MGKESACNAGVTGDAGLIPGLGRSPGGGQGMSQTQLKLLSKLVSLNC